MNNKLKLVIAGLMVAVALVTTNLSMGTPSASAQSPYCAVNPSLCTPAFCATYPQLCGQVINPIYPVYPVVNYPCGYVGCINTYNTYNTCAPIPYSPIYGYRPGCNVYPTVYNGICGYATYANPCNGPFIGGAPARVNLAVSPAIATCGSTPVTVQANITDAFGVAVANGTSVSFSSTIGGSASATTIGGNATGIINIPAGVSPGVATVRVTAGGASATSSVQVNCAVVQQVVVQQVVARPSQGQVIYQAPAQPAQQQVIIQRAPQQPRPQAPYVPPFAPPRTGEAGLTDAILAPADDTAANQALIAAYRDSEYGVLDASQYDWVVIGDDSDASSQLATDLTDAAYGVIDASQVSVVVIADDSAATTNMVVNVLSNPTDYSN